ncbi:uncharacterized protein A4U43_C01F27330 [Asparagus officinalis]|uniref:Uncharacterized protein n=2 Tax=Asparagus officinalis TaxID=4686 RepID=A0A5P1FSS9_ASPOF|nr:uncharacterized protein A4U43_C01F27330 [Asparagus officinalis]
MCGSLIGLAKFIFNTFDYEITQFRGIRVLLKWYFKVFSFMQPAEGWKEHNCIPDEHYVQTLFAQKGLEGEITRRSLTHTAWDLSSSRDRERRGWHPMTYKLSDATPKLLKAIKDIDNINYETEYRKEWCTSKGKPSKCFLFARKFTRAAALNLLNTSALVLR